MPITDLGKIVIQAKDLMMFNKVCHLTTVHSIDDVRIFVKECTSLTANGFDVTLIACGDTAFEDIKNNVKRISLFVPIKNRFQRMTKRTNAIYKKALQVNADIYHFHDPELLPIVLKLKRKGKRVVYDSHEDTPVLIRSRLWIPAAIRGIISFVFNIYENKIAKKCDAIISVTPLIVNRFQKINPNTYQITNYPIVESLYNKSLNNKKDICFAGNITHSYMIDNVIDALSKTEGTKLILAGKPVSKKYFEMLNSQTGWNKVHYVGKVTYDEVKSIYAKALVGIACLGYIPNAGYKVGTLGVLKLFEYMHAGLAVICTDFDLWENIIEKENCGLCVNPYNIDEIKNAIQYLVDNPDRAIQMGINGRSAVEREYNWATQERILINLYKKLSY